MNTFDLTLDLSKRGVIQTVPIRQGDTNGTTIVATITDHGVAASTSGLTARFQMRLPDGTHYYRKAATLSGNVATVALDEAQAASAVGRTDTAYFQLLQGSTVVASTESFTVIVLPDALADATVPESYDSAIQEAIDNANEAAEEAREAAGGTQVAVIPTGKLDSTSTATAMTATVAGIKELKDGVCVWLENGVITSASGVKLNVNGLGAKPIYSSIAEASAVTTTFNISYTMLFVYNSTRVTGGCWDMVYGYDSNTTYTPAKLGFGYGTCTTAEATKAKVSSISGYTLVAGGIVAIKFSNAVPAGSTLNVTSKGAKAIYHRGAAIADGVIKAGDTATFMYSGQYHLVSIDRDDTPDGSVTTDKLADQAVTRNKISNSLYNELSDIDYVATDATTQAVMANAGKTAVVIAPNAFGSSEESDNSRTRLCWFTMANGLEVAPIGYMADLEGVLTFYARGLRTMASGTANDTSWTITALPTDVDGVSY